MARDANGEVWVERGGQLSALNPHWKVRFDALGEDAPAGVPSGCRPHPDRARQALPPGSTVEVPCGSGWAVPAGVVG